MSPTPPRAITTLLDCLSPTRLTHLLDLYAALRRWLKRRRHEGMYEILDYDASLDLLDPAGQTALFKRRQRVKFLQDHIIAFQDYAWGDGKIFATYKCSPGVEVDRYREGDQCNILISLRETKSAGDVLDVHTERTIKRGFTHGEEWWQVEIRHQTRQFRLAIIFPPERRCRRATLTQRSRSGAQVLGPGHFSDRPDGRQVLTWETNRLKRFETYTLRWTW